MTIEQLYEIIVRQQEEIEKLTTDFKALKEWSDLNDYWLREMIDALTDSVDDLMDNHCACAKYNKQKAIRSLEKRLAREKEAAELALLEAQDD